jgi:hypothetical protein
MLRISTLLLVFLPAIGAQTLPPIEVTGYISPIDAQVWAGMSGPGLFMTIQNTSGREIQGFAFDTVFADPQSGKHLPPNHEHSAYKPPANGVLLAVNGKMSEPKPYPVPISAGAPAIYSFTVDLVVFGDGTTWGPAKTRAAQQLLRRIGQAPR